jgi:hypothetical protein
MRKSVIVVLPLMLLSGMFVDEFPAHAQCAPTDKIYIDPRLVPRQPHITQGQMLAAMLDKNISSAERMRIREMYQSQFSGQPIVVPYGTGKVLVSPSNPCIQQYIP